MKNQNIAKVLKEYRKRCGMTVEQVSGELKGCDIKAATKTIYGWESGQTQPSADTLMVLCSIYGIKNVLKAFGYIEEEELILTNEEKRLLLAYRSHSQMHEAIIKLLDLDQD